MKELCSWRNSFDCGEAHPVSYWIGNDKELHCLCDNCGKWLRSYSKVPTQNVSYFGYWREITEEKYNLYQVFK